MRCASGQYVNKLINVVVRSRERVSHRHIISWLAYWRYRYDVMTTPKLVKIHPPPSFALQSPVFSPNRNLERDGSCSPIVPLCRRQERARSCVSPVRSLGTSNTFCRSQTTARFSTRFRSPRLENACVAETFTCPRSANHQPQAKK